MPVKFIDEPLPCRRCGLPCTTIKSGGRIPLHVSCDPRFALGVVEPAVLVEAIHNLAEALGPLIRDPPAPPVKAREMGACRLCGRRIRAYGDFGHPYCTDCRKDTTR